MFLRMVTTAIRVEESERNAAAYAGSIFPALRTTPGCVFAALLQNTNNPKECISLTIWNSQKESFDYEESGLYHQLVESLRPFFAESSEWKLELSADLSLEYTPIKEEPTVKRFDDSVTGSEHISDLKATPFAVQILTVRIREDKVHEFENIFSAEIHPKYKTQKGFIDLILVHQDREYRIISFWDETVDILSPSGVDVSSEVQRSIRSVIPSFVQWQSSQKNTSIISASSEDVKSTIYRCLTAEWF
jgi:heme-degrading monooxygenase HmoA